MCKIPRCLRRRQLQYSLFHAYNFITGNLLLYYVPPLQVARKSRFVLSVVVCARSKNRKIEERSLKRIDQIVSTMAS